MRVDPEPAGCTQSNVSCGIITPRGGGDGPGRVLEYFQGAAAVEEEAESETSETMKSVLSRPSAGERVVKSVEYVEIEGRRERKSTHGGPAEAGSDCRSRRPPRSSCRYTCTTTSSASASAQRREKERRDALVVASLLEQAVDLCTDREQLLHVGLDLRVMPDLVLRARRGPSETALEIEMGTRRERTHRQRPHALEDAPCALLTLLRVLERSSPEVVDFLGEQGRHGREHRDVRVVDGVERRNDVPTGERRERRSVERVFRDVEVEGRQGRVREGRQGLVGCEVRARGTYVSVSVERERERERTHPC